MKPFKRGDKVLIRHEEKAMRYKLVYGQKYKVTHCINNRSKRGQYIELEGMGNKRFYALYFVTM